MSEDLFQISSVIDKIESCADGGWRLKIITPELTEEESTKLMKLHRKQGWMLFKETDITKEDIIIPDEGKTEFPNQKTPSERLRGVLFILHQKRGGKPEDFEDFRKTQMERFIERVKEEISKYE